MSTLNENPADVPIRLGCAAVCAFAIAFALFFIFVLGPAGDRNDELRKDCYASGGTDIGHGNVRCVYGLTGSKP